MPVEVRVAETLFMEYKRMYNVDIRIVRIFNTYGPFMNKDDGRVVSNFINQALNNENITIYGKGKQTRSFCYIDDLIKGLYLTMQSKYFNPINLGNPNEITIKELADIIINLTNSKSKIIYKKLPLDDPTNRNPDITIAENILKWSPLINLKTGINRTIDFYNN